MPGSRRCLWCGLWDGECILVDGFARLLCQECAPGVGERLEVETTITRFRESRARGSRIADAYFGEHLAGACAVCATARGSEARSATGTQVAFCYPCLLAGLDGKLVADDARFAWVEAQARASLDEHREGLLATRNAAKAPFDAALYARASRFLEKNSATGLVYADRLFELARRCKLSQRPPVALTAQEITFGFEASYDVRDPDRAAQLEVLELVLPHLEAGAVDTSLYSERSLAGWVVTYVVALHDRIGAATRTRLAQLLGRWLPRLSAHAFSDDVHADATNPSLVGQREAAYALDLLSRTFP